MTCEICADCGRSFFAETPGNALGQLADHLREQHRLTLAEHAGIYANAGAA